MYLSGNFLVVLQVGLHSHLGCSTHTFHPRLIIHFEMMDPIPGSEWAIGSGALTSVTMGLGLSSLPFYPFFFSITIKVFGFSMELPGIPINFNLLDLI